MKSLLATLPLVINATAYAQVFDPIAPVGLGVGARTDAAATTPTLLPSAPFRESAICA